MSTSTQNPVRVQLRRTKGWRKPEGAVVVSRPSKWGNPFLIGQAQLRFPRADGRESWEYEGRLHKASGEQTPFFHGDKRITWHQVRDATAEECVALYRELITGKLDLLDWSVVTRVAEARAVLAGHDLACWCPLDQPCHADVLLEVANRSG